MAFAFCILRLAFLRLAPDGIAMAKPQCMHLMPMKPSATLEVGNKGGVVEFKMADGDQLLGELGLRKPWSVSCTF